MKSILLCLAFVSLVAHAAPRPPAAPAVPATTLFHASAYVSQLYGPYREGHFAVAQMIVGATEYRGFQFQAFRPFYYEEMVPLLKLPFQVQCCIITPDQYPTGLVRVIHVFIDPNPDDGRNARSGFIGPVESFVPYGDSEIISITAPFIGRRAFKASP